MSSIRSITDTLGVMSARYETSDTVKQILGRKELVPIIGPFASGKTTLMRAAEVLDPSFGRVRSFTTRARRVGEVDDAYTFLSHKEETLQRILAQATARKLVQFTVHPTTGNVYGSAVDSYNTTHSMLDTMPSSLPGIVTLPFRSIKKVAIAVPPDVWLQRMATRLWDDNPDDIRKRLAEGIDNITWSLDQDDDLLWVVNGEGDIYVAARDMIDAIGGVRETEKSARAIAARLLKQMQVL